MWQPYSVLMSVYQKEKPHYLLESIQSMMAQTVPPSEFILVCDGKLTEALDAVIADCKAVYPCLRVIRKKTNGGLAAALATGLSVCTHDIVARMDSDDIAMPDRMELQLSILQDSPIAIVSGTVAEFEGTPDHVVSYKTLPKTNQEIVAYAKRRCPFNHPCTTFRKEAVQKAGGYQNCLWFEDYYLWLRMLKQGDIGYNIPKPILAMRAGEELYRRRGGLAYTKAALSFRKRCLAEGLCTKEDFMVTSTAHIVAGLVPNSLRKQLYSHFLRSKRNEE